MEFQIPFTTTDEGKEKLTRKETSTNLKIMQLTNVKQLQLLDK